MDRFMREAGFVLLDSDGDTCVACDNFVGLQMITRKRVFLNFVNSETQCRLCS